MGLDKVGLDLSKELIAWTRTSGKNILATKPINISTCGLRYAPEIKNDVVQISKKLIKADSSLFSWAKPKPEFSMTQVNPDSLVLVHMTNYFPKNRQILSTNLATKANDGVGCARTTIHFALNKPVTEHMAGYNWNTMDYAIIAPFKETVQNMPKSKVIGGIQDDFFFQDVVNLPMGSVIVKYNPNVNTGNFLISDALNGIKLIETSNRNLNEATSTVIKKMGFTTYNDALKNFLGASENEMQLLSSKSEEEVRQFFAHTKNHGGSDKNKKILEERLNATIKLMTDIPGGKEIINSQKKMVAEEFKWLDLYEKFSEKLNIFPKTWGNFCSKQNYINGLHSQTPWFKAEMGINGITMIEKVNNNSWGKNLKQILIRALNDAEATLPQGKSLGYDVKKVVKIIEESDTPKIAKDRIQKELKLKQMPPRPEAQDFWKEDSSSGNGEGFAEFMLKIWGLS